MDCPQCGAEIVDQGLFCHKCGHPIEDRTTDEPVASGAETFQRAAKARMGASEPDSELWHGSYSPKAMVGRYVLGGVIAVAIATGAFLWLTFPTSLLVAAAAIVIIAGGLGVWLLMHRLSVEYTLTCQRFIHQRGILKRTTDRIEVIDIDDVTVEQGPIERLLGVGTIKIVSSDRTDPELSLPGIQDATRVASLIDDTRRLERQRRGLHIESI